MRNQLIAHNSNLPGVLYSANGQLDDCRITVTADKRNELTITLGPTSITLSAFSMIELIIHLSRAMDAVADNAEKEAQA